MKNPDQLQGREILTVRIYEADFTRRLGNGEKLAVYFSVVETPEGKEIRDSDNGFHMTVGEALADTIHIIGNGGEEFSDLYRLLSNWEHGFD